MSRRDFDDELISVYENAEEKKELKPMTEDYVSARARYFTHLGVEQAERCIREKWPEVLEKYIKMLSPGSSIEVTHTLAIKMVLEMKEDGLVVLTSSEGSVT